MRRLLTVAATAVALSIPLSAATVGLAGAAGAAGAKASSSVTCTGLKGTISTTVTVSKCTPSGGKGYKTATAPASSLAAGGNLTWSKSKATTTIGNAAAKVVSPNKCGAAGTEYSFAGKVTAASTKGTGIPKKGDAVKALACVSSAGAVTLLAGTTMKL
jgi:hypothetical protein